jgi:hypothetical protein
MKAYGIMLALLCFGFITGGVNELHIYEKTLPEAPGTMKEQTVTDLQAGMQGQDPNPLMTYNMILSGGKVLMNGFLMLLTIVPTLMAYGIPLAIAMMIQGPIWLVEAWGIYQFYTGYATQGMD